MSRLDEYPYELHANVLLLDGKIENWKVGSTKADVDFWPFKSYWKTNRLNIVEEECYQRFGMGDYKIETKTWTVNDSQEHADVFYVHSKEWFRQWKHADDYKLAKAY
ncbi:hypothetical protein EBB07_28590 [Paenibacillaceae bacterium]|nr:hypothetical protein EBB07_28590 [Paenibacillaceae bacterium]